MNQYTLKNYEDKLNHQVIFMDQAVCYNPEFRATHMMHDYPSRKLQLARAVFKGDEEPTDYIADLLYNYMLSRQGERWQNFREDPEDCTDSFILCRELFAGQGYADAYKKELETALKQNSGHVYPVTDAFEKAIPVDDKSDTYILVDDATAAFASGSADDLAAYLKQQGIASKTPTKAQFLGFEWLALGFVDDGVKQLKQVIADIEATGAKKVLTLSAQATWLLTKFVEKVDIVPAFDVIYLPDTLTSLSFDGPAYVYAGSFNLRYLVNADKLNALTANNTEARNPDSPEFTPLLHGDRRINKLTIWQKPVGPEYHIFGMDAGMLDAIEKDALTDIKKADPKAIVVFEPTAIEPIKKAFPDLSVTYYLDLL